MKYVIIGRVIVALLQWALRDDDGDGVPDLFKPFLRVEEDGKP